MLTAVLLIPCYNAAKYLPRLATSVRSQSHPFSEVICYDDASTDNTATIARGLGWRVLGGETNHGVSWSRNRLAEATTSEWIHFHDADDLIGSSFLAETLKMASNDCDVVLCDSSWELEQTRERIIHWTYREAECAPDPLAYIVSHPVGVLSALIRRKSLLAVGGFDETITCWEDADFFVRLAESGARFRMVEQTLVTALRHNQGASSNQLHCDHCRLKSLRGYAGRHPARVRAVLAAEAEKVLSRFLTHGDISSAHEALTLCRELGGDPPTTFDPVLRRLKRVFPALWAMKFQNWRRRARHH